jgi:DHA1 family bicyclomycin/chloramphenicol resistance-like MFS transporter
MLKQAHADRKRDAAELDVDCLPTPLIPGKMPSPVAEAAAPAAPAAEADRQSLWLLTILSILMAFASLSTDVYLPAAPAMGLSLNANAGMMEWTISSYLIGFSSGQLLWGPIGDRFGRRLPVALGIALFVVGSAGCALAETGPQMISWRVLQAVGACAGVVLSRAMVRDLYEGPRAAQMLSTLLTVMAIAPLVGPFIGSQILVTSGWRTIFWMLVVVGIMTLVALLTLKETLPAERRNRDPLGRVLISYGALLTHRRLLGYIGAGGFFYGGIYAYIAGSPFAYISYHHIPPQYYGLLFSSGIVGIMVMNMANARLVMRFGGERLLIYGAAGTALSGIALAICCWTGWLGVWGLAVPLFVFVAANGFIVANSIAGALADFPERAGTVSALVGALQYGSGIIGSALVGALADGTPWPMGLVIGVAGIGCLASTLWVVRQRT